MIFRFSLYGFLKNQRFFEAFLVLALLEKGLSFFQIGLLVALRELTVNVLEVPSGSIADVWGRRRSIVLAFVAYIVSFAVLGLADGLAALAAAMVLYGVGDAFRSGTHKAMIFAWLQQQGREDERTKVYGYTRSWSKIGSAVSVAAASVIVIVSDRYACVFLLSIVPYLACIVNLLGYPAALDTRGGRGGGSREGGGRVSIAAVGRHMLGSVRTAVARRGLRRLVVEAMGFDGIFTATKDYLQPVLATAAVALAGSFALGTAWSDTRRTALLVGPVYIVLFLLSGVASRQSHHAVTVAGGEDRAARLLWAGAVVVFGVMAVGGWTAASGLMVAAFVALYVLHNVWRPVLIGRFVQHGAETQRASLLSIESQARRGAAMVASPLVGLAVDAVQAGGPGGAYWPVGALGLVVAVACLVTARVEPRG